MRTSKKFAIRLFPTLFCLIALLLAGCAGASNTPHTKKPSPAPASQQIFRYALAGPDITTFDPTQTQDVDSAYAIEGVFTGLVQLDDSLHIKGQMATSWNKSLDGLTWTFHMRSGLQFSDGMNLLRAHQRQREAQYRLDQDHHR